MSEYYNYFVGEPNNLKEMAIIENFDINYILLDKLPVVYHPMKANELSELVGSDTKKQENIKKLIKKINKETDREINNYNSFNIYPIVITLIIFYIFLMIFILRIVQYNYPVYYIYIIIGIIGILLLFTSLWFLYINSNLL
jgi:hypothetical protein